MNEDTLESDMWSAIHDSFGEMVRQGFATEWGERASTSTANSAYTLAVLRGLNVSKP